MRVAILGGGVSGCFLGHLLREQRRDVEITLFDKSRGLGGRCSVRRHERFGSFPLGAQFCTNKAEILTPYFEQLLDASLLEPFPHPLGYYKQPLGFQAARETQRFVGSPTMHAFVKHWGEGIPLQTQWLVAGLQKRDQEWFLQAEDGRSAGGFDVVVLTQPLPQGASMWQAHSQLPCPEIQMYPCWALHMVTEPLDLEWQSCFVRDSELSWYSSVRTETGQRWVLHASPEWSIEHLEESKAFVNEALPAALGRLLGREIKPLFYDAHRWRYASSARPDAGQAKALWDAELKLGYAADVFAGGRIEGAMESAWTLARILAQ